MEIIKRIDDEIKRLNKQIIDDESFKGRESVNLHGLVCLLRYAAWRSKEQLRDWFMRDSVEKSINPKIVKRFNLFEDENSHDGAQLRVHIFDDAEDTQKHNHQRSFISMCIQGSYEYRYYKPNLNNATGGKVLQYYTRVGGKFVEAEKHKGELKLVRYKDYRDMKGEEVETDQYGLPKEKQIFDTETGPLFVHHDWIHTVHPRNAEEAVITVLIRRQRKKTEDTTFIKIVGEDDEFQNDAPPKDASEEQANAMFEQVCNALLRGIKSGKPNISNKTNAIEEFMIPASGIARVSPEFLQDERYLKSIIQFMKLNDFSLCPVVKNSQGKQKFIQCIDQNGEAHFIEQKNCLSPETPIMFGILYTILSPKFVVPIVGDDSEFYGLLSLFDILNHIKRFASAIIAASLDAHSAELVIACSELISAIDNLHNVTGDSKYDLTNTNPEMINKILMPLGKLLLSKDLASLVVGEEFETDSERPWLAKIAKHVFKVDDRCNSPEFLDEMENTGDFSSFIQETAGGYARVSSEGFIDLNLLESTEKPENVKEKITQMWPLYVKINDNLDDKSSIGIISTEELFSKTGIRAMNDVYDKLDNENKQILADLLLKSSLRYPNFDKNDFTNVRRMFNSLNE